MKFLKQALGALFGTSVILFGLSECVKSVPEQLHCASTMYYRKSNSLIEYNVDEYLDIKSGRSSVMVDDVVRGETKMYYNQIQLDNSGPRQFIMYDPISLRCESLAIGFWQFSHLRRLAIYMTPIDRMKKEFMEIPIGPSVLLYAIQDIVAAFEYVGQTYSKSRLSEMHVYSKQFRYVEMSSKRNQVIVMVHVPSRLNLAKKPGKGDKLGHYLDNTAAGMGAISLVSACLVSVEAGGADRGMTGQRENPDGELDSDRLDEDNFCPQNKVLFSIRYNIISERLLGSLTGQSLDEGKKRHDFHRQPFMKPAGIGCWGSGNLGDVDETKGQQLRQLALGQSKFSALYTTERGFSSVMFVAYDKSYHLLRLDQRTLKSVYDLEAKKSYHIGEFGSSVQKEGSVESGVESCVVLDLKQNEDDQTEPLLQQQHDPLSEFTGGGSILEQLIGLTPDYNKEHYLGTKVIDHVAYEVFECEVHRIESTGNFDVPIILRPLKRLSNDRSLKMFVTFYARIEPNSIRGGDSVGLLKFIELSAFDTIAKRRAVLNRLKFIEFSWSLDVEPINDFDSPTPNTNWALFSVEPCYNQRASQAELVINYKRDKLQAEMAGRQLDMGQQLALLRANEQQILEQIGSQMMINALDIRPTNLVDLSLQFTPAGDMISSSRIVDLKEGLLKTERLGWISLKDYTSWTKDLKTRYRGHFWLRDCQLKSIASRDKNWFAHCPVLGHCLIFNPGISLKNIDSLKQEMSVKNPDDLDKHYSCFVYSLQYSLVDKVKESPGAIASAELNAWHLPRRTLELSFDYLHDQQLKQFKYDTTPMVRKFSTLDSIKVRLANEAAFLTGLKHTTADQEHGGINANQRFMPTKSGIDLFRQCQLACQMDSNCASFSVCSNSKLKPETTQATPVQLAGECVLSSLRLTNERLASMIDGDNKKTSFEVRVSSECESRSFVLVREDSCSLHPRDFLASYERSQPTLVAEQKTPATPQAFVPTLTGNDQSSEHSDEEESERLTLEECAGRTFESCKYDKPNDNSFTYCPLESICLIHRNGPSSKPGRVHDDMQCFTYTRRLKEVYLMAPMTTVTLIKTGQVNNDGDKAITSSATVDSEVLPEKTARKDGVIGLVKRSLWGLGKQGCAYECNLHRSNCLAFDSCRVGKHELCKLYSIRSPINKIGAYFPLTNLERQVQDSITVKLTGTKSCSHHALRHGYFEVRLRQILDRDLMNESTKTKTINEQRLDKIEGLIQSSDNETSKLELETINDELNQMKEKQIEWQKQDIQHSSGIHLMFLVVGLLFGCLSAVFKDQISHVAKQATPKSIVHLNPFAFCQKRANDMNELLLEEQLKRNNEAMGRSVFQ